MLLEGKGLAESIISSLEFTGKPGLAVILVGKNPASLLYTSKKVEACRKAGIHSERHELPEDVMESKLIELIKKLNMDSDIHGILIQLPLPEHIDRDKVLIAVDPKKDVDGFHPVNLGKLMSGSPHMVPCTPKGVMRLLEQTKVNLVGKNAVIIGDSIIVGRPIVQLLVNAGATVTVCHIQTQDLKSHTLMADILISATGVPKLVKKDMVKKGAIVIDVGTTKLDGRLVGDVDFEKVREVAGYITPVPGGVGPMTIACLLENTVKAYND